MSIYHITETERGWELRKQGATRPSKIAASQAEILQLTAEFLRNRIATVKVHDRNGNLIKELSYPPEADEHAG